MANDKDKQAFLNAMAGVRPLKNKGRIDLDRDKIKPVPVRNQRHLQAEFSGTGSHNTAITDAPAEHNRGLNKSQWKKLKQGQLSPQAEVDLHGCRQNDALQLLAALFAESRQYHYRILRIVHGKGQHAGSQGTLKALTRHYLYHNDYVLAYCPASIMHGGFGATYVYLTQNMR